MTFPIVLLVAGIVLLFIGLFGKIQLQQLVAESSSKSIRVLACIVGIALMGVSYIVYTNDKQPPHDDSNTNAGRTSASPVGTTTPTNLQSPGSSSTATRSHRCDQILPGISNNSIAVGLRGNFFSREQSKDKLVGITLTDKQNQPIGAITFVTKFTSNPATSRDDVVFTDMALYDSTCKRTDEYENDTNRDNKPDVHNDDQVVVTLGGKQYWLILEYNYDEKYVSAQLRDRKIRG
jgi:hypothetical protein